MLKLDMDQALADYRFNDALAHFGWVPLERVLGLLSGADQTGYGARQGQIATARKAAAR